MKQLLLHIGMAAGLALVAGCGGERGGNHCKELASKLCEGKDDAYCKRTRTWLDSKLTGPDGSKLAAAEAAQGCKLILEDMNALDAYKANAAKDLEPATGENVP